MIKLGDLLKSKREGRGLTLEQVSENTKIPIELLNALENSNYDLFSSEVYLKGFIKNYSKFLGIETTKALAIYRREQRDFKEDSLRDSQRPIKQPKAFITPGRIVLLITLFILVSVISFVTIQVNKLVQPPSLELTSPLVGSAPSELYLEVESDSISIKGRVEVGSRLLVNGSEVTTNNLQEFSVDNYSLNPGSNEIYIVAESYYFSKTSQIKLTILSETNPEAKEPEDENSEEEILNEVDQQLNASLEILEEPAWVVITVDDEPKLQDTLESGTTYNFKAKSVFTIYSPRPNMLKLTVNGEEYTFGSQTPATFRLINGDVIQE
ncbi:MAG: helix-turn-helix domain-containing protein [Candidatus Dojkabacteria bacterium]|nr:helix-turn-helix domain-containing protein [Candidatus Dojkabacteria bacterium]